MADRMEANWQPGMTLAEQQYADLCNGIKRRLPSERECMFVPVIMGSMSIPEQAFEKATEQLGVAKAARRALLNELMSTLQKSRAGQDVGASERNWRKTGAHSHSSQPTDVGRCWRPRGK